MMCSLPLNGIHNTMGGRAFHSLLQQRKQATHTHSYTHQAECFDKGNNSSVYWLEQQCDPPSFCLLKVIPSKRKGGTLAVHSFKTKYFDGTHFWLMNHRLQPVVETYRPHFEGIFLFLLMTGHLWYHASTGWASLVQRNLCHWLSDLGYRTQDTFCDKIVSLDLSDS